MMRVVVWTALWGITMGVIKITVWQPHVDVQTEGDDVTTWDALSRAVHTFEAKHKGAVKVELRKAAWGWLQTLVKYTHCEYITSQGKHVEPTWECDKMKQQLESKVLDLRPDIPDEDKWSLKDWKPADILAVGSTWTGDFVDRQVLRSLQPYLNEWRQSRPYGDISYDMYKNLATDYVYDKQWWVLPLNMDARIIYYNKKLYRAVFGDAKAEAGPESWEDVVENSIAIQTFLKHPHNQQWRIENHFPLEHWGNALPMVGEGHPAAHATLQGFIPYYLSYGASILDDQGGCGFRTPRWRSAMKMYIDHCNPTDPSRKVSPRCNLTMGDLRPMFAKGETSHLVGGAWVYNGLYCSGWSGKYRDKYCKEHANMGWRQCSKRAPDVFAAAAEAALERCRSEGYWAITRSELADGLGLGKIPRGPLGRFTFLGGSGWGLPKWNSDEQASWAWQFLQHVNEPESREMFEFVEEKGYLPAYDSLLAQVDKKRSPTFEAMVLNIPYAYPQTFPSLGFKKMGQVAEDDVVPSMLYRVGHLGWDVNTAIDQGCAELAKSTWVPPAVDRVVVVQQGLSMVLWIVMCAVGVVLLVIVAILGWRATANWRAYRRMYNNNVVAQNCADAIASMRLSDVEYLTHLERPNAIQASFVRIITILENVKKFVPDALLITMAEEDESEGLNEAPVTVAASIAEVSEKKVRTSVETGSSRSRSSGQSRISKTTRLRDFAERGWVKKRLFVLTVTVQFEQHVAARLAHAGPEEVRDMYSVAYNVVLGAVKSRGGSIEEMGPDWIICVWGSVRTVGNQLELLCGAALHIRHAFAQTSLPVYVQMGLAKAPGICGSLTAANQSRFMSVGYVVQQSFALAWNLIHDLTGVQPGMESAASPVGPTVLIYTTMDVFKDAKYLFDFTPVGFASSGQGHSLEEFGVFSLKCQLDEAMADEWMYQLEHQVKEGDSAASADMETLQSVMEFFLHHKRNSTVVQKCTHLVEESSHQGVVAVARHMLSAIADREACPEMQP